MATREVDPVVEVHFAEGEARHAGLGVDADGGKANAERCCEGGLGLVGRGNAAQGAKARVNRAKYSAGPNRSAILTSCGASRIRPQVARKAPTKEATPDSERASPARPCWAIG